MVSRKPNLETRQRRERIDRKLRELKLVAFADRLSSQYDTPASEEQCFEERLDQLLGMEIEARSEKRTGRLLKKCGMHVREQDARMEDIIVSDERGLRAAMWLRLKGCDWMTQRRPPSLLITGMSWCGKTYIASALLRQACEMGLTSKYIRAPQLCSLLAQARKDGTIDRKLNMFKKIHLLVIDDLGINRMDREQCSDILDVIMERYEYMPTIYASQYPVEEWVKLMPKEAAANAILDRVIHGSYLLELKGESLRRDVDQ